MAEQKREQRDARKQEATDTTPSGKALAAVGNLDGEDVDQDGYEAANAHGERYLAEKRKHRWGN